VGGKGGDGMRWDGMGEKEENDKRDGRIRKCSCLGSLFCVVALLVEREIEMGRS
jgi:hypothetical protein